jgi:hypothetical protein
MFLILFDTQWKNIRLTNFFCGIARLHVFYIRFTCIRAMSDQRIVDALGQHQINELLLWGRPNSCFLPTWHAPGQCKTNEVLLWDRPSSCFPSGFTLTHWGNIRLTNGSWGLARSIFFYTVSHALCQYQTNELLLWDRSDSCFYCVFTCVGVTSD